MLVTELVTLSKLFGMAKGDINKAEFTLAKYHKGKRPFVDFWVFDESKGQKVRMQKFVPSTIKNPKEQAIWAKEVIAQINQLLESGYIKGKVEEPTTKPDSMLFSTAIEYALSIKLASTAKNTARSYRSAKNIIFDFLRESGFEDILLSDFSKKHVYLYVDYLLLERENSNTTVNNQIEYLTALLNVLIEREFISKNPASGVKSLAEEVGGNIAFPTHIKDSIMTYIEKKDPQLHLFVNCIYYCYIRPNELRELRIKHIDFVNKKINIPSDISKNNKSMYVTIPNKLLDLMFKHKLNHRADDELVFMKVKKQLPINEMRNRHLAVLRKFDLVGDHTLYSWKHTGVCSAYRAGIDIKSIQRQLRHSSVAQTEIYLKSLGLEENKAFFDFE